MVDDLCFIKNLWFLGFLGFRGLFRVILGILGEVHLRRFNIRLFLLLVTLVGGDSLSFGLFLVCETAVG